MSGTWPPLTRAISLATAICDGELSSPKNCVAALPGMLLFRPRGAWVANTNPRPYLRACDDSASVLCVATVVRPDGAKFCASSITSSPPSGRSPAGLRLIHANSAICSWLTKPAR